MQYRLKIFHNLRIVTYGFSQEDEERMASLIQKNDGIVVGMEDQSATHVVSYFLLNLDKNFSLYSCNIFLMKVILKK